LPGKNALRRHLWISGWIRTHRPALRLGGCFLSVSLTTAFVRVVPEANRLLWVANGVWLAYLLLAPRSRWRAYLGTGFAAQFLGGLLANPGAETSLFLAALNLLEVLLTALLLRRRSRVLPNFTDRVYLLRFVLVAVVGMPLCFGLSLGAVLHLWRHTGVISQALRWALADGLGAGVTAPACVAIFRSHFRRNRSLQSNWVYLLLAAGLSFAVCTQSRAPLQFLIYPVLVLILLRMGLGWASLATLLVAGLATWPLLHGAGPFAAIVTSPALGPEVVLQLFIASAMAILYSISVVLESRRATEHRLAEIAALHNLVAENSRDLIIIADFDGNRSYVSAAAVGWEGWQREELLSRGSLDLVHDDDRALVNATFRELRSGLDGALIEYRVKRKDGQYVWAEASLRTIRDSVTHIPTGVLNSVRDITERKLAEQKLQDAYHAVEALAITDGLTGLANRRRFDQCLTQEWRRGMRDRSPLSLLLIDADLFKSYNDTYGHLRGDSCLKQIAESAQDVVARPGDLVARFGGEEFAVLLPSTGNEGAVHIAEEIGAALRARQLPHKGNPPGIATISIGCATLVPRLGENSTHLIESADEALYRAKRSGRNQVCNSANAPLAEETIASQKEPVSQKSAG
jgi:diguanylate cyclase (GGDEF)-like protein/PAS domain S-box-containing protein